MSLRNFGSQLIATTGLQFPPANNKAVCRFQNLSGAELLVSKFYGDWGATRSTTAKVKAVIYSDNAGVPDQLLAASDERVGIPNKWNALTFSTPLVIAANAYVWFGVISDTMLNGVATSGGAVKYNSNTYSSGPTTTFGTPSTAAYTYRMFLEGTDGTLSFGRRSIDITGIASGDGNYQPDREHVEKAVLGGTDSVMVESISTYITNTSATVKSKAAIYSDSAGYPGTKLAQSDEVTGSTADTWLTLPITGGVTLDPGTYWLAFIADTNLTTAVIPFSGSLIADGPMTEASAFSSTYPTGSPVTIFDPVTDGRGIDIYASYTDIAASEAVGSSDGVGAASATGASTATATGSSAGSSTAAATGSSSATAVASASGTATTSGVGMAIFAATGAAAGSAAVLGTGSSTAIAVAASEGVASVSGAGASSAQAVGSASGTSSASAVSESTNVGSATGSSTVAGVGASTATSVAGSAGTSATTGTGAAIAVAVASASGVSAVAGVGHAIASGIATSNGASTASAAGMAQALAVGTSAGSSQASGIAISTAAAIGTSAGSGAATGWSPLHANPLHTYIGQERTRLLVHAKQRTLTGAPRIRSM